MSIKDSMASSLNSAVDYTAMKMSEAANYTANKIVNLPTEIKNDVMDNFHKMANPKPSPEEKKPVVTEEKKTEQEKLMDGMEKMVSDIQKMINQMFSQMVISAVDYMSNKKSSEHDVTESDVDTIERSSIEEVEMDGLEETNLFAMLPFHDEDCEQLDLQDKVELFAQLPGHEDDCNELDLKDAAVSEIFAKLPFDVNIPEIDDESATDAASFSKKLG